MKVFFSKRAQREAVRIDRWWRENRNAAPNLFTHDLVGAIHRLQDHGTRIGQAYTKVGERQVYRILMQDSEQHVYYRHDPPDTIVVLAIWGGRRGRGPKLR